MVRFENGVTQFLQKARNPLNEISSLEFILFIDIEAKKKINKRKDKN